MDAHEDGVLGLGSLSHIVRGDLRDPEVSDQPLIGAFNQEADDRATEVYFRRDRIPAATSADSNEVYVDGRKNVQEKALEAKFAVFTEAMSHDDAGDEDWAEPKILHQGTHTKWEDLKSKIEDRNTLVDLAAEKQKRINAIVGKYETKDSGSREEFTTGSRRDTREGKGRYDLLPPYAIQRLAQVYERGAQKYDPRNWEKGQPLTRFLDSALRHTFQVLEGKTDEDHAGQAAWNLLAFIEIQHRINEGILPAELDDM